MPVDILEKLAEVPVPPMPERKEFDRVLHERINQRLVAGQLGDLFLRGFGFAAVHFAGAVMGMLKMTITGSWGDSLDKRRKE